MERINFNITKQEKIRIRVQAVSRGMTLTEYIKYKLIENNLDLSNNEYVYQCPSGERYNYSIAGLSMLNYLLLKLLVEKLCGDASAPLINQNVDEARKKIDELYGYRRTKVEREENE